MKTLNLRFRILKKLVQSSLLACFCFPACLELQENSVSRHLEKQDVLVEESVLPNQVPELSLANYCCSTGKECQLNFHINILGEDKGLKFSFQASQSRAVEVALGDQSARLELPETFVQDRARMCQDPNIATTLEHKAKIESQLASALSFYHPSCMNPKLEQGTWQCQEPSFALEKEKTSLAVMKQHMLKKWVGHPYVLARRLMINSQLIAILTGEIEDKKFASFCTLVRKSMDSELPLIMQSRVWQSYLCDKAPQIREQVARRAVELANKELAFFIELADRSNKRANILVKLPMSDQKNRLLSVDLKANRDVGLGLVNTALLMQVKAQPSMANGEFVSDGEQWDPFFDSRSNLFQIAKILGFFSSSSASSQKQMVDLEKENTVIASYLIRSIVGESSFVVTNGRYKILHLPIGSYEYSIAQHHASNHEKWWKPAAENRSTGQFKWGESNLTIQSW